MGYALTAAELNGILDQASRIYQLISDSFGDGTFGITDAVADMQAFVVSDFTSVQSMSVVDDQLLVLAAGVPVNIIVGNLLSGLIGTISSNAGTAGISNVTDLETYLTYLNKTGTPPGNDYWQALQHRNFRAVQSALGVTPQVWNYYDEILTDATNPDGLARYDGAYTDGAEINGLEAVGGFPYLNVASVTGADDVEVLANVWDPVTGDLVLSKTFTAAVSGTGLVALTPGGADPAPTYSLIQDVLTDGITPGGSISAIDVTVESHRPTGRLLVA
jgi:hypothetical protein